MMPRFFISRSVGPFVFTEDRPPTSHVARRTPHVRHPEAGFALIELVISLFLMVLITGLVYASYVFVSKAWVGWKRNMALESDLHLVMQRVAEDLTYAEQFIVLNDSTWVLRGRAQKQIQYAHQDSILTRNGVRMHHTDVLVTRFVLFPSRTPTAYARTRHEVEPNEAQALVQVQVNLQVQGWSLALEAATHVALRPHRPWPLVWQKGRGKPWFAGEAIRVAQYQEAA